MWSYGSKVPLLKYPTEIEISIPDIKFKFPANSSLDRRPKFSICHLYIQQNNNNNNKTFQ